MGGGRLRWPLRAILLCSLVGARAEAVEVTLAGSVSLDHREAFSSAGRLSTPGTLGIDSTNLEIAQKVIVDITQNVSFTAKACAGCHGLEVDQAFAELHINDLLNLRVGRINVPIGEFNARHDPANYTAPSKPLPYAMGDMLRYNTNEFNLGVLPTPYSDNGLELFGGIAVGGGLQLDYTVYAVKGLVGQNDLDWVASRRFQDANRTPAVGVRVVGSKGDVSLGASFCAGYYDARDRLAYLIGGLEGYARLGNVVVRGEVIGRRTDFDQSLPGYLYEIVDPYFLKLGWYAQIDWELRDFITLIYRADGLHRLGMPLPGSVVDQVDASILRNTASVLLRSRSGFVFKLGYEYWLFQGVPFENEHVVRAALVFGY
jgi:hypothetical protein